MGVPRSYSFSLREKVALKAPDEGEEAEKTAPVLSALRCHFTAG